MITIKDNKSRGNAVKIVFYLMMGLGIISIWSNIMQYFLLKASINGVMITTEVAEQNDSRQRLIAILTLLLIIAAIITFIMWFSRAYQNLHALKIRTLKFTPGWAVGTWFVPILNLGRPYLIMKEIWEETQEFFLAKEEKFLVSSANLVGFWWASWIANNLISNISSRMLLSANSVDDYITSTSFSLFSDVISIVSMIITLIMVSRMMDYENKLAEHVNTLNSAPTVMEPVVTEAVPPAFPS